MSRFYFDWCYGTRTGAGASVSWLVELPKMYDNAKPGTLLRNSIRALAKVNYGKRCGNAEAVEAGSELYGEALRMMREIIVSNAHVPMRDVLVSVVLLGFYETIVEPSISSLGSWLSHVGGSAMLLKKKRPSDQDHQSPIDIQIRSMIFRQMAHGSIMAGRAPVLTLEEADPLKDPQLHHLEKHRSLIYQAVLYCSEWNAALGSMRDPSSLERLTAIAAKALVLDDEIQSSAANLPQPFGYTVKPITAAENVPKWVHNILACSGAPDSSHDYSSPVSEMLWRFYWVTRLILCQALLYTDRVLHAKGAPFNPIAKRREAVESALAHVIQRSCESCVTPIVQAVEQKDTGAVEVQDIASIRGYLMLQVLPTVSLCIDQTAQDYAHLDLESRRPWLKAMKDLLQVGLGFSKAAAEINTLLLNDLPIQLWGQEHTKVDP
ncbi:hypothetical protein LIA77_06769 [Sarocladium implicatum]|nr:hypothetical protein LIA77_06769 [Sarocladium implicatum]